MKNATLSLPEIALAACLAAGLAGCGADAGSSPMEDDDGFDRAAAQEELGRISQAFSEATCGSTAADAVLDPNVTQSISSVDGSYDHATCRNGYVIDVPGVRAGRQFTGGPPLRRWPDPFTCLFNWGYLGLWQKQPDGTYAKVAENSRLGTWAPVSQVGYVCSARVGVQAPADGDYKLVSAAGVLFGPYGEVSVY